MKRHSPLLTNAPYTTLLRAYDDGKKDNVTYSERVAVDRLNGMLNIISNYGTMLAI